MHEIAGNSKEGRRRLDVVRHDGGFSESRRSNQSARGASLMLPAGRPRPAAPQHGLRPSSGRKKLLDLMLDDVVPTSEGKEEMLGLTARRDERQHQIETAHEPLPRLHPSIAAST